MIYLNFNILYEKNHNLKKINIINILRLDSHFEYKIEIIS